MAAKVEHEPGDVYVLRISGILEHSEFAAAQTTIAARIESGSRPRLLAVFENFTGWERNADWAALDFFMAYGDEIARIAIVAEPEWEDRALAFAGAGLRSAPVKFFPPTELEQARAWAAQ